MSDMMEFLESLTNKELRAKCLEYNLPNVPVTDTSRKILIKKLNAIMSGKPEPKKKAPTRRETIHVTNIDVSLEDCESDESDKPKSKLNRTFPSASAKSSRQASKQSSVKKADSGKADINSNISSSSALKQKSKKEAVPARDDSRVRRSVSLSKSGVTTTSYSVEVEPVEETDEDFDEMEVDEVEEIDSNQNDFYVQTVPPSRNFNNSYNIQAPAYENDDYLLENSFAKRSAGSAYLQHNTLQSMSIPASNAVHSLYEPDQPRFTYESSSQERPSYQNPNHYATANRESVEIKRTAFPTSAGAQSSYQPTNANQSATARPSLYPFDMLNSTASSVASDISSHSYTAPRTYAKNRTTTQTISPKPYKRVTIQAPNQRNSYRPSYGLNDGDADETEESESQSEYDDSSSISKQKHLSTDFSRKIKFTSSPRASVTPSPLSRPGIHDKDSSAMEHFARFFQALDAKYHISQFLTYSAALIFIIFLFVMFFL